MNDIYYTYKIAIWTFDTQITVILVVTTPTIYPMGVFVNVEEFLFHLNEKQDRFESFLTLIQKSLTIML